MIDARLNFKPQAEHVSTKAAVVGKTLSRLMPNVGGPKQKRRALLMSVTTPVLTYGRRAFRTVSEDAVCVIAGMLPIEVLAKERQAIYQRKKSSKLSSEEVGREERQNSIRRWQILWDATTKGR
ncbi:unnamed protein product [Euphydryas editha]|uniref:Uncharacterized protein n=1 Tax=Euphydryas editha TaxID=104508 RepID=A0AAU9U0F7_EUPED|nr:unnamed protein product [Euphydryas editha]